MPATAYTPTTTQAITNYIPKLLFAPAGVPVFDHNPTTGEALGLSVWEARTNLLQRSQEFDNAYWGKSGSTVSANTIIAPDGTLSADTLIETATAANHFIFRSEASLTAAGAYTVTVYAKYAGRFLLLLISNSVSGDVYAYFDLQNGTITKAGTASGAMWTSPSATITPVGNGWYRCSVTGTKDAVGNAQAQVRLSNASTGTQSISYTGDGYSGIYIWGAQLEAGAFATPYIPTVASTVARSADAAVMTGANFSRWFNPAEGTLYTESQLPTLQTVGNPRVASLSDNTNNNELSTLYALGTPALGFNAKVNNSFVAILSTTVASSAITSASKNAAAYRVNDFAMSVNGATVATDTAGTLPIVNRLNIGAGPIDISGSQAINGNIRTIAYYPARLTNAQLQAITG